MLNILTSQNLKNQAVNILKNVYGICNENKNNSIAFITKEILLDEFLSITEKSKEDIIIEFTDKIEDKYLNASIFLELQSKLIFDLQDKTLFNNDIDSIRRMIIPLKYKHNVKDIFIDNLEKITVKELEHIENKEFVTEYKIMKLYYISKKFEVNFYIGIELLENVEHPKHIKDIKYRDIYDMVDEIKYNQEHLPTTAVL